MQLRVDLRADTVAAELVRMAIELRDAGRRGPMRQVARQAVRRVRAKGGNKI